MESAACAASPWALRSLARSSLTTISINRFGTVFSILLRAPSASCLFVSILHFRCIVNPCVCVCVCVCVPLEICAASIVVLLISCLILNGSIVDGHHWIDIYLERGTASPACRSNFEISFCQFLDEFIGAVE